MSGAVTIRRFPSLPEAMACASYLEANGIEAFMDEYHHATVQWFLIPALGGLRVSVPVRQKDAAEALLQRVDQGETLTNEDEYDPPHSYARLSAWLFLLVPAGLITIPLTLAAIPFVMAHIALNSSDIAIELGNGSVIGWGYIDMLASCVFAIFMTITLIFIYLNAKRFLENRTKEVPKR